MIRLLRSGGSAAGCTAVFAACFATALVVHSSLAPSRRLLSRLVARELSQGMAGTIEVDSIEQLSPTRLQALGITVREPAGRPVLFVSRLDVTAPILSMAWSALFGTGTLHVQVPWLRADHIDVELAKDADGALTLARAFSPRPGLVPAVPPVKPARLVVVDLGGIEIGTIAARGRLSPLGDIDADAATVHGSLHAGPDGIRIDADPSALVARNLFKHTTIGSVDVHVRSPGAIWGTFVGKAGDAEVTGGVKLEGKRLDLVVDVPRAKGREISSFVPGLAIDDEVSARLEARGELPELETRLRMSVGRAQFAAHGTCRVGERPRADFDLELRGLDAHALVAEAPTTYVDADMRVAVDLADSGKARVAMRGKATTAWVAGYELPSTEFDASFDEGGVRGTAKLFEPGMPIEATGRMMPDGVVTVRATSTIPSLEAVPRLAKAVKGSASVSVEGRFSHGQLDAVFSANLHDVSRGNARIRQARFNGHAWGKAPDLTMDIGMVGRGVDLGGLSWKEATATLRGPVRSPHLEAALRDDVAPSFTSKAALALGHRIEARDVHIGVGRGDQTFTVNAETVDIRKDEIDFGGIAIDGLGAPVDGVVRVGTNGFDVRLVSRGVDLATLSRVLSISGYDLAGTAAVDIDVKNVGAQSTGCIRVDWHDGRVGLIGGIELSARARLAGIHVDVDSNLAVGSSAAVPEAPAQGGACLPAAPVRSEAILVGAVSGDLSLHGSPMRAASWRDATGTARLTQLVLDLDRVAGLVRLVRTASPHFRIPELRGKIRVGGEVARASPTALPSWTLTAASERFSATYDDGGANRTIQNVDFAVSASMASEGQLRSSVCLRTDSGAAGKSSCDPTSRATMAAWESVAALDYARLVEMPREWRGILNDAHVRGRLIVPDQSVGNVFRTFGFEGPLPVDSRHVALVIDLSGTARDPQIQFDGYVDRPTIGDEVVPATACMSGSYDGAQAAMTAWFGRGRDRSSRISPAMVCDSIRRGGDVGQLAGAVRQVGLVQGAATIAWRDVVRGPALGQVPWEGSLTFKIDDVQLGEFAALADRNIAGQLRIEGGVAGLGRSPEFILEANVNGLRFGENFTYDQGRLQLRADSAGLRGSVDLKSFDSAAHRNVNAYLSADLVSKQPLQWQAGAWPGLSAQQSVAIHTTMGRFPAAALLPFAEPVLSYLEGELTGFVNVTVSADPNKARLDEAYLSLSSGAFQIPTIGQEFINVSATVKTTAPNRLAVEGFNAKALSGSVAGAAAIVLEPWRVASASASLATDQKNRLRLTIEGVPVGDVYGQAVAQFVATKERNEVQVELARVHVDMSEIDQRKVQTLENNKDIVVVPSTRLVPPISAGRDARKRQAEDRWMSVRASGESEAGAHGAPWHVVVRLHDPVEVQRSGMRFAVMTRADGQELPSIDYPDASTGELTMRGQVRLKEGRVDVAGKFFTIEPDRALVTFDGDPSNPGLSVTARWDAPDGTRVIADVTGTLQAPRVQLRSDPAKSANEILAMILFGGSSESERAMTAAEAQRQGGGGAGAAAAGLGGGVAATGINRLLDDVAPMSISTRVETTGSQTVRPSVVVQVAKDVTAQATANPGANPLGQNPDHYLLTLDWRFLSKWSLRTTVGSAGSSILDVLWTHRY